MERSRRNWVYVGRSGVRAGALLRTCVTATLRLARAVLPQRVLVQRWIRYRIDLTAARAWADRTGWRRCGTITRYQVDLPGLRAHALYLHRHDAAPMPALVLPSPSVHARTAQRPGLGTPVVFD